MGGGLHKDNWIIMNSKLSVNKDLNAEANVLEDPVCFQGQWPKTRQSTEDCRLCFCFAAGFSCVIVHLCDFFVCVVFFSLTESFPNTLSTWRVNLKGGFRPRLSPSLGPISRTPLVEVTSRTERWWTVGRDKLVGKYMIFALFWTVQI